MLLVCLAMRAPAEDVSTDISSVIDWQHGLIVTDATVDLRSLDGPLVLGF